MGNRALNSVIWYIMCVDELLVKDSHSYQVGWVGFGPGQQVTVPQRMTVGMKDYWYLVEVVVMEASILPSDDSVAGFVQDLRFASYLGKGVVNWKVCTSHYFEAFSCCAPS
jgi:hypothetical protein